MFSVIGKKITELETPALLIDLYRFERNLAKLSKTMKKYPGVATRPHGKAHKCPTIAHMQVEKGAVGLCCQKLSEAESMVVAGVKDILISNEVIGKSKLYRLASLAKQANLSVCVDNAQNVQEMSQAAVIFGTTVNVIVEVNVGQNRCGVEPGEPVVALAKEIIAQPNLVFRGIQTYQGWNQHIRKYEDRQAAVGKVVDKTKKALDALSANNIPCEVVTGGGTGTYTFEAASEVFTEVQPISLFLINHDAYLEKVDYERKKNVVINMEFLPGFRIHGSYIFMDVDYGKNFGQGDSPFVDFEQSLYVLSTVISVTPGDRAILDAGMKAVSLDSGPPLVKDRPELVYHSGGDEHGILRPSGELKVGDQVWLVPGHCDPTVNMHDTFIGVRNGMVETVWPITGRGPGV